MPIHNSPVGLAVRGLSPIANVIGIGIDLLSGAQPSVTAVTAGLTGVSGIAGAAARAAAAAGSSVGPGAVQAANLPSVITQVAGPIVATAARGAVQAVLNQPIPSGGAVGGGGVRTVTRKQMILLQARAANAGATAKKIIRSARECGIELAAATFGLSVLDVCFLIAQPPTRRSRGISAADMRRTRSTIRKVLTISHQIQALKPAARRKSYARN